VLAREVVEAGRGAGNAGPGEASSRRRTGYPDPRNRLPDRERKLRSQRGPADGNAGDAGVLPRAAPHGLPDPASARGRGQAAGRGPEPPSSPGLNARGPPPLCPVLFARTNPEAGVAATWDGPHGPLRVAQGSLRETAGWVCPSRHPGTRFVPVLARDDPA